VRVKVDPATRSLPRSVERAGKESGGLAGCGGACGARLTPTQITPFIPADACPATGPTCLYSPGVVMRTEITAEAPGRRSGVAVPRSQKSTTVYCVPGVAFVNAVTRKGAGLGHGPAGRFATGHDAATSSAMPAPVAASIVRLQHDA
jgi:hypothetical protein